MSEWVEITTIQDDTEGKRRFLKARDLKQRMAIVNCPYTSLYGPRDFRGLLDCWHCPSMDCPRSRVFNG